jgi:hypothetical protein
VIRFYLVPVLVTPATGARTPKYFATRYSPAPGGFAVPLASRDYGNEPSMLVAADMTDVDNATLVANTDVTKFADNLDQPLGADLATMTAALEALNLPAQMLTVATTHRQVVRGILAVFGVAGCMQGKGFRVFGAAITLATTLGSLPVAARTALQDCATALGYDQTGLTLASTVRQLLSVLVQQAAPAAMLGVTI